MINLENKLLKQFNNFIIVSAIVTNFLLFLLFLYRVPAHSFLFNLFFLSIIIVILLFYIFTIFYLNTEWKAVISISSITIIISLIIVEILLINSTFFNRGLALKKSQENAKLYEPRSKLEYMKDLISQGLDPVPIFPPSIWRGKLDFKSENDAVRYSLENNIYPLSGISNKLTVNCNESGYWAEYESDKYGFNNPNYAYKKNIDIISIGDSFVQGACVKMDEDVTSHLRKFNYTSLNYGYAGSGPLIELAILKEYASIYKPKNLLWFYFRGDVEDLFSELKNEILIKYLNNDYSQNLINRQDEIDNFLSKYLDKRISAVDIMVKEFKKKKEAKFLKSQLIIQDNIHGKFLEILFFFKFTNIRNLLNLYDNKYSCVDYFCAEETKNDFSKILLKAKETTESWGGNFYFIYLPSWEEYTNNKPFLQNKKELINIVKSLDIQVVDFNDVLSNQENPLSYFPFELPNHYTNEGYALLANQINETLKNNN